MDEISNIDLGKIINLQRTEPKIKLVKGQRDSYGWEITLPQDTNESYKEWVERMAVINTLLQKEFNPSQTSTKLKEDK